MTEETSTTRLREALANRTGTEPRDWYPVFKARYGMLETFAALRRAHGDGVVRTQLFTCCTAVDPIIVAGLTPWYEEVDPRTLSIDATRLTDSAEAGDGKPTLAVMLQHTFGIIDNAADLRLAEATRAIPGALLVEDCAHCVARMARGDDGSPRADVSVHSFGVEKILPTRFGGAVWVNPKLAESDPAVDADLRARLEGLPRPGRRIDLVTRAYINENRVFSRIGSMGGKLRRAFTGAGLYEPPIAAVEQAGGLAYRPMRPTPWIEHRAAEAISALSSNENGRRHVVAIYREQLGDVADQLGIPTGVMTGRPQPLLRFPLFMDSTEAAERVLESVRAAGGYAERWYRPELFPGVTDPSRYGVDDDVHARLKETGRLVAGAVCLPTELGERTARDVADAVLRMV